MNNRMLRGAAAASLLCVGLAATGAAFAQDPPQDPRSQQTTTPPNPKQATMKECVQRERRADSTLSESEAKKTCQDAQQAKRENHDNEPQPPHQR